MAGHGGAMDRLDSSLFISPVIYLFYLFVIL
jgi:CDP-diglyceride synthetase